MKKLLLITMVFTLIGCSTINEVTVTFDKAYKEATAPYSNTVVCSLTISGTVGQTPFKNQFDAKGSLESTPLSITITDLDKETPILIANDGYRVDLIKPTTIGSDNMLYLFEKTDFGNLNVWTLFRDKNIIALTKQYNLVNTPFAYAMMGTCKSGI